MRELLQESYFEEQRVVSTERQMKNEKLDMRRLSQKEKRFIVEISEPTNWLNQPGSRGTIEEQAKIRL